MSRLDELSRIKTVFIVGDEDFLKFIVVKVIELIDGEPKSRLFLRADKATNRHFVIRQNFIDEIGRDKTENLQIHCEGGGFLGYSLEKKIIIVSSFSNDYGREPGRETTTVEMLKSEYPDFEIKVI
jgi:hypothetical protein